MSEATARELLRALAEAGRPWPAPVEHHERIGSTNDRARALAREGAPEWSVVLADEQASGRGRSGRRWHSAGGDLFLSVLLRPQIPPELIGLLPLAAGVAVAEALRPFGVEARLKWPNDVTAGGRKLAGILTEAISEGPAVEAVVIGVGVNLALEPSSLGGELASLATSLRTETGRDPGPLAAAAGVLTRLAVCYDRLTRGGAAELLPAWKALALPWWGRRVQVRSGGRLLTGLAEDVDARGALVLRGDDGARLTVLAGDARELRPGPEGTWASS